MNPQKKKMKKANVVQLFIEKVKEEGQAQFLATGKLDRTIKVMNKISNDIVQVEVFTLEDAPPQIYAHKLEEVQDMVNCFAACSAKENSEVICTIYSELIDGPEKDALFFHIKTKNEERREVVMIDKAPMMVNEDGTLSMARNTINYVNVIQ